MQRCPSFLLVFTVLLWWSAFPSRVTALVFFITNPSLELVQGEIDGSQIVPTLTPTPTPNPTRDERMLRLGDRGEAVKQLQSQLKELGYYTGKIDGEYGVSTRLAVAKFQAAKGLSSDGVVGTTTRMQIEGEIQARTTVVGAKPESENQKQKRSPGRGMWWWVFAGMGIVGSGGAIAFTVSKLKPKKPESDPTVIIPDEAIAIDGELVRGNQAINQRLEASRVPSAPTTDGEFLSNQQNYHDSEDTRTDYTPVGNHEQTFIQTNGYYSSIPEQTVIQTEQHYSFVSDHEQTVLQITDTEVEPWERHTSEQKFLPPEISGRIAKVNIIDEIVKELRSPDPNKRRKAIWDLGQQGDSRAIQPLVDLLMDADSQQRSLILGALSEIGVRTLKPMNRALAISLQDESPEVRQNAIRDLTRVYDLMAQLSQMLCHAVEDPDANVQATARYALTQFNRLRTLANSEVNRNE